MAQFEMNGTELKKCKPDRGETKIVIPEGVTKLAGRLFKGRKTITKVTLPESLTVIGEQAFLECEKLESCNLPESLQDIGQCAFEGCTALKSITLPSHTVAMHGNAFRGCTGLTEAVFPVGWTEVPYAIFVDCTNLRRVVIPEGVTNIHGMAFQGCTALESLTLPESLTRIDGGDIIANSGVRSIRIPARATDIRDDFLGNATALEKIEYAVFPQKGTKLYENLQKMLKQYPYLADAVAAADNVPQEFREYIDWIRAGAKFPREKDLRWPQELIKKLKYDDYIILFDTDHRLNMDVYRVVGSEYTECHEESLNCGTPEAQQIYYDWKEHFHWMMTNDRAFRAYRYANGELAEVREISDQNYSSCVYKGCKNEMILRTEFGLEPQSAEHKAKFAAALAEAEKVKQTLVYACFINDTPAIIARAKTATKAELHFLDRRESFNCPPLIYCIRHDNLAGFKALAAAGADIAKTYDRGYLSTLDEARIHAPSILLYIFEEHRAVFNKHFGGWGNDLFYCKDPQMRELFFKEYGPQGLEECYFTALLKPPAGMDSIAFLTAHHVDCSRFVSKYRKCTALEFAEQQCAEYPDDPGFRAALDMIRAEAQRQMQEA